MESDIEPHVLTSKYADKERQHLLVQSIVHTSKMPNKSMAPKLIEALNFWFKLPNDKLDKVINIFRLIQATNNTIIDVSENAMARNGKSTANSVYSLADALNSSYYCCFLILERLRDLENFEAVKFGNEYFLDSSKGYGLETYWRDNIICPSEEEYVRMGTLKTGSVIRIVIKLMQLLSGNKKDLTKLTNSLAQFFHIYDDYVSLHAMDDYLLNKNGTDMISEGKFSFPMVHAICTKPNDVQLLNILRQKTKEEELIKYCLKLLEKFGSLEYTKQILKNLKEEAEKEMKQMEENPHMKKIFEDILSKLKIN
ncbi:hypothetical protein Zmor_023470 [Zophobas morio]|uniref:Geranylgeranyl pyrophosphate synthase n=2 Tax=Zophobas morio TaxID=2755281 RepID=A0AA38HYQ6_9CUCU|nr:hypothetical protein Zmor_023470 [Zophobas morio]